MVIDSQPFYVSDEIQQKRFDICKACPDLREDKTCAHCLCPMEIKTKIDWFGCPVGKWAAEV